MPQRIQRKRTRGWRMPENAVYVGRGSIWGNPFVVGAPSGCDFKDGGDPTPMIPELSLEKSLEFYRSLIGGMISPEMHPHGHQWFNAIQKKCGGHPGEIARTFLRGKNLACWCALDQACHADVLLELANK
jgi:hypothetical protein